MQFNVQVTGIKEINKVFKNLPRTTQNRAMRPALRVGGNVVKSAAAVNVQTVADRGYATGFLARSLRVYALRKYRGMLRVAVMIRRGAVNVKKIVNGAPVRAGLYGSVLEYGKENQAPRSWIRKAAREKTSEVVQAVTTEARKNMVQAVNEAKR